MGCDIHLHIEVKIWGEWEHYACPDINRYYSIFGKMAGVRGGPAMVEPRGVPQDATMVTLIDNKRWGRDAHSHSWLSSDEVSELAAVTEKEMRQEYEEELAEGLIDADSVDPRRTWSFECNFLQYTYLFGNSMTRFKEYPDDYPVELEDFRFVFWFDS